MCNTRFDTRYGLNAHSVEFETQNILVKKVNILSSKQDIILNPTALCSLIIYFSVHKMPDVYSCYFGNTEYLAEVDKGGSLVFLMLTKLDIR